MTGFLDTGIGASDVDTGDIGHSLRFRSGATAYLTKTSGTPTNKSKWTLSFWVRKAELSRTQVLFNATVSVAANFAFQFDVSNSVVVQFSNTLYMQSTSVNRDHTAWMHFVVSYDSANATTAERCRVWENGTEITSWITDNRSSLGTSNDAWNTSALTHYIGSNNASYKNDDYKSRIAFIDGTALTPSSFGYLNTETNTWVTKTQSQVKAVVDAGGTNSFMLDFDDGTSLTTLGNDFSSKGNDWTLNNFSITPGTTYDHMIDVPGNSFATLNPLAATTYPGTLSEANLKTVTTITGGGNTYGTTAIPSSGKYYWEVTIGTGNSPLVGVASYNPAETYLYSNTNAAQYLNNGQKYVDGSASAYGSTFTTNDVIGVAVDAGAGSVTFYKNNTSQGAITHAASGLFPVFSDGASGTGDTAYFNFGQAPLHTSATYDSASGGYFRYTPPTGFKALCQANLPTPAILDPTDHHKVVLVTKSGNTNFTIPWDASVYDTLFKIKRCDAIGAWYWLDGLRGYNKYLSSDSTNAETTDANVLSVSGTTGTLGSTLTDGTYVVYMWKAGLAASRQTNTDGSITSTVSRNITAGFSIVTYTGSGANATVGHGLGVSLDHIVVKNRTTTAKDWPIWNQNLTSGAYCLFQNTTAAQSSSATIWNSTAPTSTVFSVGTSTVTNTNTDNYVAYCFAEVPGYSKFGAYTGDASADGPYANLGFLPSYLEVKRTDSTSDYGIADVARSDINVADDLILMNTTAAESATTWLDIDALGFKIRSATQHNVTTGTYIYSAFAKTAGKFSNSR